MKSMGELRGRYLSDFNEIKKYILKDAAEGAARNEAIESLFAIYLEAQENGDGIFVIHENSAKEYAKEICEGLPAKKGGYKKWIIVVTAVLAMVLCAAVLLFGSGDEKPNEVFEIAHQVYTPDIGPVIYSKDDGIRTSATFANTGDCKLWLSSDLWLERLDGEDWVKVNADIPNAGTIMVMPHESVDFCTGVPEERIYENIIPGDYRIIREIFVDENLENSGGYAEHWFQIELKDNSSSYFVIESDEKGSINEFEGFSIYSEIENISEETIYLSFKYELAAKTGEEWRVFSTPDTHPGSSQAIPSGERAKFCEDLSSAYFMNKGLDFDGKFRIRREVFLDPELKESVGFAECIFGIKVRGTSAEVNPQPGSDDSGEGVPVPVGEEYLIPINERVTTTLFNNGNKTYYVTDDGQKLMMILSYLNIGEWSDNKELLGKALSPVDTVEFARESDGKKYTLSLYENGFILNGSAVPEYQKGKTYIVQTENWGEFKRIAQEEYAQEGDSTPYYRPYWLGLINYKNVAHISVALNGENTMHYLPEDSCFERLIGVLRSVNIEPSSMKKIAGNKLDVPSGEYIYATVFFNTETSYKIAFSKDSVMMVSSDMNYGISYMVIDHTYEDIKEFSSEDNPEGNPATGKPVIYLYPEKETEVLVDLDFDGKLTYTYPALNDGWKVTAKPDGTLINLADGSTHYYLFWEGYANPEWKHEKGFVVKGSETEKFLRDNLAKMGLTPREYNDFITYWVPKMQENAYNLISFSGEEYSEIAKLTVHPKPDYVIRIHMVWMGLDEPIDIEPQVIPTYQRKGFTLVEWGGTEVFE